MKRESKGRYANGFTTSVTESVAVPLGHSVGQGKHHVCAAVECRINGSQRAVSRVDWNSPYQSARRNVHSWKSSFHVVHGDIKCDDGCLVVLRRCRRSRFLNLGQYSAIVNHLREMRSLYALYAVLFLQALTGLVERYCLAEAVEVFRAMDAASARPLFRSAFLRRGLALVGDTGEHTCSRQRLASDSPQVLFLSFLHLMIPFQLCVLYQLSEHRVHAPRPPRRLGRSGRRPRRRSAAHVLGDKFAAGEKGAVGLHDRQRGPLGLLAVLRRHAHNA